MGCWNGTCAVSNLHVTAGQKVAVFLLLENKDKRSFCYGNAMYDLCPIPFYGEYNDYGAVENCHGFGMNIVLEALRERLYEFGQGPNSAHDDTVNKGNLTIETLFDADHEDRLGIQETSNWNNDEYDLRELEKQRLGEGLTDSQQFELDRLANKIKQVDTFRRVTHVIIHGDVFDDIMNKWYVEEYIGDGKGTHGYNKNYIRIYFRDIKASVDEYISEKKKVAEELKTIEDPTLKWSFKRLGRSDGWNSPNLATKWLNGFSRGSSMEFGLVRVEEIIEEYTDAEDWDNLASFAVEALTGLWVNAFMSNIRKAWAQTPGKGSQNSDELGYRVLIESMASVLDAEKAEREEWDAEEEPTDEETAEATAYFLPKGDPK
jgi:hypothetical protein